MRQTSVIIVNWNTANLLLKCLEALVRLPEQECIRHVVVIDNASQDDSIEQAREIAGANGYTIIREQHNLGFAKANNRALEYIQKHGGLEDHILLLNPDTEVHPKAIRSMMNVFERNARAGIIGPKLLEVGGDIQQSVRSFPTLSVFILFFLKLHRIFSALPLWKSYMMTAFDYEKEQVVDQVMGAAFLIRNDAIQHMGLFDEAFWIWFEEVDFCKRAQDAGWNTVYTPDATIVHHGGISFGQLHGLAKTKRFLDSSLIYAKKHLGYVAYGILLALYPIGILIGMLASILFL